MIHFKAGEVVWEAGQSVEHVVLVAEGKLRLIPTGTSWKLSTHSIYFARLKGSVTIVVCPKSRQPLTLAGGKTFVAGSMLLHCRG